MTHSGRAWRGGAARGEFGLEMFAQLGCDFFGCCRGAKAGDDLPVFPDKEFRKVPGDILFALVVGIALLEEIVELASAVSVDFDFGKYRKRGVKFRFSELEDLFVGAGLLAPKLIAGESENRKSAGFIFFVQCTQTCVLGSKASFARDVDNQADPPFVARKPNALARDRSHFKIVNARHGVLLVDAEKLASDRGNARTRDFPRVQAILNPGENDHGVKLSFEWGTLSRNFV